MESRMKFLGHAVHPILVMVPLALFATAVDFDAIGWAPGNGRRLGGEFIVHIPYDI